MATTYDYAMLYYPRLWSRERIEALVSAGRLTKQQAKQIYAKKGESK